jgi:hypothetical protein
MSINTKKELLTNLQIKYKAAKSRAEKTKIIDSLVSSVGYKRKYSISLLNKELMIPTPTKRFCPPAKYDQSVKLALITVWYAANQICSKRLKPFLPDFISSLERHSHLSLTNEVRTKLLNISTGTIDSLLKSERIKLGKSVTATRSGSLLKKQIKVRTFADWDNVVPGFFEADLVAHCGGSTNGSFLNTLTLTDIASGWTECLPLLCKNKENVIDGLRTAMEVLQFKVLGIDTDNGSEFINHALVQFCSDNNITFTRSRKYKKNDQAHVEEKNGSIVRRLVGYDRFEGVDAQQALTELYANVRLYVNFFQPSLKLLSKSRDGSKVTKKYDSAKTPCQRLLDNSNISSSVKKILKRQSNNLDPVILLQEIQSKQQSLFKHAWKEEGNILIAPTNTTLAAIDTVKSNDKSNTVMLLKKYQRTKKIKEPRTYRTRNNPFEDVQDEIKVRLEMNPNLTAKTILDNLIKQYPDKYQMGQIRTLQRRMTDWRKKHQYKKNLLIIQQIQAVKQL